MALLPGVRLGPYEVQSPLGAGGMGEVYRARDTRLDRTVAVKILPEHLSEKAEARERFDREARTISSISHPNICHLYDVGEHDGISYLVLEYLQGETLADRLRKGPLPLEQVLQVGTEICEGLEKAHRSGVVHRDLKPSNIMLTKSGAKLMDFGLAKAATAAVGANSSSDALDTISRPLTSQGTIVGTFQYMSPEQIEGREADTRSDIFSLGAMLYEMITGKRAFEGKTTASTIAAILAGEPKPLSTAQLLSAPALQRVVNACLAKEPDERLQTAHDVKLQLQWIADSNSRPETSALAYKGASKRSWIAAAIAFVALLAALLTVYLVRPAAVPQVVRSSILPPDKSSFLELLVSVESSPVAVAPDGSRIVVGLIGEENKKVLYVRPLKALTGQVLVGTEGATFPFWSPDSRSIGFFANGQLKTIDASGGPVQALCSAPQARGGTWNRDGVIIFSPTPSSGIFRVSATGGAPEPVTKVDFSRHEDSHRWPQFLPDGRRFIYLARTVDRSSSQIHLGSLEKAEPVNIVRSDGNPAYADGYLLYPRGNVLVAQPLDIDHVRVSGEAVTVAEVSTNRNVDYSAFSVSANGVLAYQQAVGQGITELTWMDRSGKVLGKIGPPGGYLGPSLSPDGRRLAVEIEDPNIQANSDIWIYDLIRNFRTRLTFSGSYEHNRLPVWSPDGSQIAFSSDRSRQSQQLYVKAISGKDSEHVVSPSEDDRYPTSWSPDGQHIAGVQQDLKRGTTFLLLSMLGTPKTVDFLPGATGLSRFSFPRISPNGKWIAYSSFESGRAELYISLFPSGTGKWQVSTNGGRDSIWRRDGRELFFTTPFDDSLMSAEISEQNGDPIIGKVRPLFRIRVASSPHRVFDVSPDGKRFLINSVLPPSAPEPITLVVNWGAELKKK
jgi:eukaryotic-like serine/threonine-protein kinase